MLLVIGNKNYSSWSLRPWIALKVFGFDFDEKKIPLDQEGTKGAILAHSPAGKVPILVDGKNTVWDSLAILEYLAERNRKLWPADPAERASARSLAAEMHSGFPSLRHHMSMNVRKRYAGKGRTPEVLAEIERIKAIWNEARKPFLFGVFTAVDAMYAPVVLRFRTYDVAPARGAQLLRRHAGAAGDAGMDRRRGARDRIDPAARHVRVKAYVVGGAVRDELLGLPLKDKDYVVVGATPEEMVRRGFKPVGKDFPVFLHPQTKEEYALARTERKSGRGYKGFTVHAAPEVTLEDDLRRRDLTINAMARDENGALIDPFGGEKDLKHKVLRHVSDAFAEDPVRILRVARFAARFGFQVFPDTMWLMKKMVASGEADHLVPERVWQELAK